ncbi:CC_3452 family protein [Alteraurantiacibacter aquimixticola]|uniref:Uncharacterized protein n=1 Tax=Alteraurantiacibacter aquimixticola TaxID=2489173 RepID=A0A4T3F1I8_9SPHN|nr:hypothetical protein [Alteraurantiacibacter aquimixticola]TIX51026.1 hypothetical protein E5222_00625 [Alteraurantiacibacter aquimixticola]
MTLSKIALPLTAAAAVFSLGAPAALAQGGSAGFTAELAEPAADNRVIAGGVLWSCSGTSCTAPINGKRPLRVCHDLKREVGAITSFAVGGEALDAERLERCNR